MRFLILILQFNFRNLILNKTSRSFNNSNLVYFFTHEASPNRRGVANFSVEWIRVCVANDSVVEFLICFNVLDCNFASNSNFFGVNFFRVYNNG